MERRRHPIFTQRLIFLLVNFKCRISNITKLSIVVDLTKKRSEKDISIDNNVSPNTVERIMDSYYSEIKLYKHHLPKVLSFDEFKERLLKKNPEAIINTPNDIGTPVVSEGGSVKSVIIGGKEFSGRDIRSIFSLRSSCFKIKADEKTITFEVSGYGHGGGMSQYGANTMAKEGYNYIQILTHYYTGTKVEGV